LFSRSGYYDEEAKAVIRQAGEDFFKSVVSCVRIGTDDFKSFAKNVEQATGIKGRALFMPLRAALTGEVYDPTWEKIWPNGPTMEHVWSLLGPERIQRRFEAAAAQFKSL
jgi:glutamyl-tRNA synthetase